MRRIHGKEKANKCRQQYYKQRISKEGQKTDSPSKRTVVRPVGKAKTDTDRPLKPISPTKFYQKPKVLAKTPTKQSAQLSDTSGSQAIEGVAEGEDNE